MSLLAVVEQVRDGTVAHPTPTGSLLALPWRAHPNAAVPHSRTRDCAVLLLCCQRRSILAPGGPHPHK